MGEPASERGWEGGDATAVAPQGARHLSALLDPVDFRGAYLPLAFALLHSRHPLRPIASTDRSFVSLSESAEPGWSKFCGFLPKLFLIAWLALAIHERL